MLQLLQIQYRIRHIYILNYVRDFFRVNGITLNFFYNFEKQFDIRTDKLQSLIWNLRLYHESKKGRHVEHLLDTTSYSDYVYRIGNRKHIFRR